MEAASARMAARDRYSGFMEPATTPLQRMIQNAVDPQNFEPNLALDLEVADLVNSKKGAAPREAAVAIVGHVNNRNPNISLLALTLLDICVKNCGYPFHLQVSTKEFLNELVRRFPERPPMRYSRVQSKILELIEEWRSTICQTSKHKEDLGFIRDMHRLLSYKGYTFPAVKREDAAVLNPSDSLQSAEEMEEEERSAQSAKLQELIRRGTPHDLQEANRLMKVMAGYDTRHKTDYRAKAAEEVSKIQQKAKILEEMLANYNPQDRATDESAEELSNALASAHPKIQKMCEEESEDHEAVAKLLEINDSIHRTQERYKLMKKGDVDAAARIPRGTLGTSGAGVTKGPGNELSLIDFGPADGASAASASQAAPPAAAAQPQSLENDLLGLSLGSGTDSTAGIGGQISLGGPAPQAAPASSASAKQSIMDSFNLPAQSAFAPPAPSSSSQFTMPPQLQQQTQPQAQPQPQAQAQAPPRHARDASFAGLQSRPAGSPDPFASLGGAGAGIGSPRGASPAQFQQRVSGAPTTVAAAAPSPFSPPPTAPSTAKPAPTTATQPTNGASSTSTGAGGLDDDWQFASALPSGAHEITVAHSDALHISFHVSRPAGGAPDEMLVQSAVGNNAGVPMSDFTLQVAVAKSLTLTLTPQSSRTAAPGVRAAITQEMRLRGVAPGQGASVRMRWRASYWLGGQRREESGEVGGLGVP